jgi:hypothetical protein
MEARPFGAFDEANPAFADMQLIDGQSFEVWGVITHSIRML